MIRKLLGKLAFLSLLCIIVTGTVNFANAANVSSSGGTSSSSSYSSRCSHSYTKKSTLVKYLVSSATCTSPAKYVKSCSKCGAAGSETFTVGKALGHSSTNVNKKDAGCTTAGYKNGTKCSRCGVILSGCQTIAALGHNYQYSSVTWDGYTKATLTYKCSRCKGTKDVSTTDIDNEVTTKATCTKAGTRTYTATLKASKSPNNTKKTVTKTKSISKLDHDYKYSSVSWDEYAKATLKYKCSRCDDTKKVATTSISSEVTTKATCT